MRLAKHNQPFASPAPTCGTQSATERDRDDARKREHRPSANAAYSQLLLSELNPQGSTRNLRQEGVKWLYEGDSLSLRARRTNSLSRLARACSIASGFKP